MTSSEKRFKDMIYFLITRRISYGIFPNFTFLNYQAMRTIFSFILIFCFFTIKAQNETTLQTSISGVTVFLQGAQVSRAGSLQLPAGDSKVVISGLSQYLNSESIQVKGKGAFTILSVNHRINYLRNLKKPKNIVVLEDSLELLNFNLEKENAFLRALQQEEEMLLANKDIGGQNAGVNLTDLKTATTFFREKINEIGLLKIKTNRKIKDLKEDIDRIQNQLNQLNARRNQPMSEIVVAVSSPRAMQVSFDASYYVPQAGWTPAYDLRATSIKDPVDLVYKGNVYQTTGESWDDVMLTLSTGNPVLSGTKPNLQPWYLYFYTSRKYETSQKKSAMRSEMAAPSLAEVEEVAYDEVAVYQEAVTITGQTTTEFAIPVKYTVPSDGDYYTVRIAEHSLPATYKYYAVPKLDKDAFLLAEISDWEDLELLSGEASLFFEGTYVGSSYLDAAATTDTLQFSLGRDRNIVITREKLKDFTASQFIGPNKRETIGFEITVKNNKKEAIDIVIEDQVPLSTNKEIEVSIEEKSGAKYNQTTGILKWTFNLKPAENKKLRLIYEVKYPKERKVILE